MDNIIQIKNISKSLNRHNIFNDFSVNIPRNSFTYVRGTNGIGKSIILKLMAKLFNPNKGTIIVNGTISYMPDVFPNNNKATVIEYLTFIFKLAHSKDSHNMKDTLNYYFEEFNLK